MNIIDKINNITFWLVRLLPIVVICLLTFKYYVFGIETLILETLILAEYYLLVTVKFNKFEIAEGPLVLLLSQLSIVVYAVSELNIVTIDSPILSRVIFVLVLFLYLYLTYLFARGFVFVKIEKESDDINLPICNDSILTGESKVLLLCFDEIDNIQQTFLEHRMAINNLSVPVPQEIVNGDSNVCTDYIKTLSDLPNQNPSLASLEQFYEIMAANQNWEGIFDSVQTALGEISSDVGHYVVEWKSILSDAGHNLADYVHHPDPDTTANLLSNLVKVSNHIMDSPIAKHGFAHAAEGFGGVPFYITKKFSSVLAKSSFETFADTAHIHDINEEFISDLHDAWNDMISNASNSVEVDVFSPDFDGSAQFPFISTAIEACRLVGKFTDGDVDMVSAAEKSAVKIAGTASGAYIGSAIGTFLCPGVGTAIGAMVGSWFGRRTANDINRQELKRLQKEYENEYENLLRIAEDAKRNIENIQQNTTDQIISVAVYEHEQFELMKCSNPFEELNIDGVLYAVDMVLYDFLMQELRKGKASRELLKYIPTKNQIRLFPKESLKLMLSYHSMVNESGQEDEYYNFNMILETCIEMMLKKVVLCETIQCGWYTEIYTSYKESVSNILVKSNQFMEDFVRFVVRENNKVDNQKRIVIAAEQRVKDEAKTL